MDTNVLSWLGLHNTRIESLQKNKAPPTSALNMTLNNLLEYPFIAITPGSSTTRSDSTRWDPTYGSNRSV